MPSKAMQDLIDAFKYQQQASASQAPPALERRRADFTPAGRLHPVPDDVLVTEVTAGGVPAHWLDAPEADTGRVLLFLHGGGFQMGSLSSHGELAARLGRASAMRVLFPEYRLAPEHPFPAAIDDVLAAWRATVTPAEGRDPQQTVIDVAGHIAQMSMHASGVFGYQQWYLFDDVWAAAHPELAASLMRYAASWSPSPEPRHDIRS
jgi:acetyl esterase/lipase